MHPQTFVRRWNETNLNEEQTYSLHFSDLSEMAGFKRPDGTGKDDRGREFLVQINVKKTDGRQGFADVYYEDHFAIEYKAPGKYKNLTEAYDQLLQYRENLKNPPLLIVTDINTWEIHTNYHNTDKRIYAFTHQQIASDEDVQNWIEAIFHDPMRLHPNRNAEELTIEAANGFKIVVDNMRDKWQANPERIAHFLTKLIFCLFAEDIELLPTMDSGRGIFSEIIHRTHNKRTSFLKNVGDLFEAMANGGELFFEPILYFNGSVFDDITVESLSYDALTRLDDVARLNWQSVEPSIFGTLFERSLDPDKRAQLGAHYTSRADILLIVDPVLMQPLRRAWQQTLEAAAPAYEKYQQVKDGSNRRRITTQVTKLQKLRDDMLTKIREIKVLDPACGSGNFLYVALQELMMLEKQVITHEYFQLKPDHLEPAEPKVHPAQMYGIEINPIAHALASIVVWIGYIQWRQQNGYRRQFGNPILEDLSENIICADAILTYDENGDPAEPRWATVDVIIGNPPFLGGSLIRGELGDDYYEQLTTLYKDRVPGFADLVCYWFEKARAHIAAGGAKRAGLLSTNSIRGGANREVLKRIKESGDIFMAWSDREWTLEGAAVRVSMTGFDDGSEDEKMLDGVPVAEINPDLTGGVNLSVAVKLGQNSKICHRTDEKGGAFDIDETIAQKMLSEVNESGVQNSDVVRPYLNARDLMQRPRGVWVIDFGVDTTKEQAMQYESPFQYVMTHVKPHRDTVRSAKERNNWWLHRRPAPDMRRAVSNLERYIVTPETSKHRVFQWIDGSIVPDHKLYAVARSDDYFFGVLHSKLHEIWSLRMGSWHGKGNDPRYTITTTFETFPFPWSPGAEDTDNEHHQAIAAAAKQLHEERHAWLNPGSPHAKRGELEGGKSLPLRSEGTEGGKNFPIRSGGTEGGKNFPIRSEGTEGGKSLPLRSEGTEGGKNFPIRSGGTEGGKSLPLRSEGTEGGKSLPIRSGGTEGGLKHRTLTNLYNALAVFRGEDTIKTKPAAGDFAPRLHELHTALDNAVCAAYGWSPDILHDEETILRNLLALNLQRAAEQE